MKATAPWFDEQFCAGVHIVPDFEPEAQPQQYQTLVLMGPEPLSLWELLAAVGLVTFSMLSTCGFVVALYLVAKRFL